MCTIFVGTAHTPFLVRKDAIGECDFLADLVTFTEDHKSHIKLYDRKETNVEAEAFLPVHEYLTRQEFQPRLIDHVTYQRLEGVMLSEEKDTAAVNIAKIYLTASKIKFGRVQVLCMYKIKALYPMSSTSLLIVFQVLKRAELWGCDTEYQINGWFVQDALSS